MPTDRIEKRILLRAPRSRVWSALTDSKQFGEWFGIRVDEPFVAGKNVKGVIVGTKVDAEVAAAQKKYDGKTMDLEIVKIEPQRLFSFRWHPHAIDEGVDYSSEPTTLIEFTLEDAPGGVMLTVTESGFDRIPVERRAKAFNANEQGWGMVVELIERYVADAR
ncbi:MAG: SRPBCC family protein [Candidatus Acidiferrales bacterium]